ncbi:hypothetical protein NA57DRAFT_79481 [Rhizodiscina lignyota]|uniref:Uncharacterized protein n=1 Tax=Rhizodiscina lignyota TaxID=1504668 RepID=A0A9P4M1U3_9PEZI|nr:hypothetical protein NA57DRAFT_79481 [Rhizodiscina lignyota]
MAPIPNDKISVIDPATTSAGGRPNAPSPIAKGGAKMSAKGFTIYGETREDPHELEELMFPHKVEGYGCQRDAMQRLRQKGSPWWLASQLAHYGFECSLEWDDKRLLAALKSAVKHGQCKVVPDRLQQLEKDLRKEFEPAKQEYDAKMAAWEKRRAEEFRKMKDPVMEASYDANRFIKKYLFPPNIRQRTEAIALPGFKNKEVLVDVANEIPGLWALTCGKGGDILIIGWKRGEVEVVQKLFNDSAHLQSEEFREYYLARIRFGGESVRDIMKTFLRGRMNEQEREATTTLLELKVQFPYFG